MKDDLVTIIGSSFFEPITVLLESLEKHDKGGVGTIQAGYFVNGFAASICLLAVVCLESYVMRVRYMNKATQKQIDKVSVPAYLRNLYSDFPFEQELSEIHIVRDAIAHNHLWELSYTWADDHSVVVDSINKRSTGDDKYQKLVNTSTTTGKLRLNVNPINVGKTDAISVLQTMWKILLFLEEKNRNQCYVSHLGVRYKGKQTKFGEVLGLPETCT